MFQPDRIDMLAAELKDLREGFWAVEEALYELGYELKRVSPHEQAWKAVKREGAKRESA